MMKKFLFLAFGTAVSLVCLTPFSSATDTPCFRLYQTIETKKSDAPDAAYRVVSVVPNTFLSEKILNSNAVYGVLVSWGYAVRGENLWLPARTQQGSSLLTIQDNALHALIRFEQEEFPMQGNWKLVWKKRHIFNLGDPFVLVSRILDKDFRVSLFWEESPDPEVCDRFLEKIGG